jgi:hypothetical protein
MNWLSERSDLLSKLWQMQKTVPHFPVRYQLTSFPVAAPKQIEKPVDVG